VAWLKAEFQEQNPTKEKNKIVPRVFNYLKFMADCTVYMEMHIS
jgi:hypothetical protein